MNPTKKQAMALRKLGLTYREIQEKLDQRFPKSTLSYWFRDINLTKPQSKRIAAIASDNLAVARKAALASNKRILEARLEEIAQSARKFVGSFSDREAKLALAMLYLGEGGKYPVTRGLYLGSSEPRIVLLYIQLLIRCFDIKLEDLKCSVYYRADQNIEQLRQFWSETTGIPLRNFHSTRPDPRTYNKPTQNKSYKGVARIYHKGTNVQIELDHIADAILEAMTTS